MVVPNDWQYEFAFDGGDLSCGDLILDLRNYITPLTVGVTILVTARDGGAVIDIPAWCWSTGHSLLNKNHPFYLIRKNPKQEE